MPWELFVGKSGVYEWLNCLFEIRGLLLTIRQLYLRDILRWFSTPFPAAVTITIEEVWGRFGVRAQDITYYMILDLSPFLLLIVTCVTWLILIRKCNRLWRALISSQISFLARSSSKQWLAAICSFVQEAPNSLKTLISCRGMPLMFSTSSSNLVAPHLWYAIEWYVISARLTHHTTPHRIRCVHVRRYQLCLLKAKS